MLDRRFVLENPDLIRENLKKRHVPLDFEHLLKLEKARRACDGRLQEANGEAKRLASNSALKDSEKREAGKRLREEREKIRAELAALEEESDALFSLLPNLTDARVPLGADDKDGREYARSKTAPASFDFPMRDHVALGEALDILDFESGSRVAGAGFYYLKNAGVRLERALESYALEKVEAEGFSLHAPPELVRGDILTGAGYTPRGTESNSYALEGEDLHLIATSEIPLCGMHSESILEKSALPLKLAGTSRCFRSERAAGRQSRGLFRVHQFTKVEMVILCRPEESDEMLEELLRIEREIFDGLEIPYRVIEVASGDLGAPAYRKYDIEAWMPSRGAEGSYAEVTSASNCTDYQARRLKIRYREKEGAKPLFLHSLNGTVLALGRAMIAILENGQRKDGSVRIPKVLQRFMGAETISPSRR